MNKIKKISVIVPVYNVEDYIEQCIESIINQTLKEIEIIINDGTKDNSIKKIEKYLSDSRVILINKENGGLSSARNAGLKVARGEYISFVDSDDFIEPTMLEDLYLNAQGADITFSDVMVLNEKAKEEKISKFSHPLKFKQGKGSYFWQFPRFEVWNKIYKREFLKDNNITFKEGIIYEDVIFLLNVFFKTKNVKYLEKVHYHYRINRLGSIMNDSLILKKKIAINTIITEYEKSILEAKDNFGKFRIYIWQISWIVKLYKLQDKKIEKRKIKEIEKQLLEYGNKKYNTDEKRILKSDLKRLFEIDEIQEINIFNILFWKNSIFSKNKLKKILINKIKKKILNLF